jgi:hypothetical protein
MSACTIVFLGGKERVVLPAARIGFHQPAFRGMTASSRRAAIATEEARLQRFGLSKAFADKANVATPSGMWFPDKDELVREKVVTRVMQPQPVVAKSAASPATSSSSSPPTANAAPAAPVAGTPKVLPGVAARAAAEEGRTTIPADVIKRLSSEMSRLGMKKVQPVAPAPQATPADAAPAAETVGEQK